jgi:hypothetical protein
MITIPFIITVKLSGVNEAMMQEQSQAYPAELSRLDSSSGTYFRTRVNPKDRIFDTLILNKL